MTQPETPSPESPRPEALPPAPDVADAEATPLASGPGGATAADIFPTTPNTGLATAPHVPIELAQASPGDGGVPHPFPPAGIVTLPAPAPAAPPTAPALLRRQLKGLAMTLTLALLLMGAAYYAYRTNTHDNYQRQRCIVAVIIAAVGATLCLAGAMRSIDGLISATPAPRWYWRWSGALLVRLLLIIELATSGAALACGGLIYFQKDIPMPGAAGKSFAAAVAPARPTGTPGRGGARRGSFTPVGP